MWLQSIDTQFAMVIGSTFIAFGALAWLVLDALTSGRDRASKRLQALSDPRRAVVDEKEAKKSEALSRVLEKASPAFAKPLTPTNEKEMSKLRQDLSEAGFRSETAPLSYLTLRGICAVVFLMAGGGFSVFAYGLTYAALVRTFIVGALGFYLPTIALSYLKHRRKTQIFLGLPDALDLLVVCVEAGLGLDQAMRRVAEEMQKSYPVIANEFGLCNLQLQMGRPRNEVLSDLGARTGVDDLRSLASIPTPSRGAITRRPFAACARCWRKARRRSEWWRSSRRTCAGRCMSRSSPRPGARRPRSRRA